MHRQSREEMAKFVTEYAYNHCPDHPCLAGNLQVADIGAYDVNGIYRDLFDPKRFDYLGFDIAAGPNVDHVLDPTALQLGPFLHRFDIAISGQTLEHVRQPWLWLLGIANMVYPGGLVCIIAPHTWPYHEHPIDCWRIYPEGMLGLFDYADIEPIKVYKSELWQGPNGPEGDTVGIGRVI